MSSDDTGAALAIEVRRDDWTTTREVPLESRELEPGEVLLRIDAFALTSNNVTYATLGDMLGYWRFFPAADEGWGRVPAFGFADVAESLVEGLDPGERVYGYYPMATHLRVAAKATGRGTFDSVAPHRAELPAFYNRYLLTGADPGYDAAHEAEQMLLRPLFSTSFLIDDALADEGFHGADAVVLSSASSKTAYGTAFLLAQRGDVQVIGLTSAGNADWVRSLGIYDSVVTYDAVDTLDSEGRVAYVDFSGDGALRGALHHGLGERLVLDMIVGVTHHDAMTPQADLPGPQPAMFLAPLRGQQRATEWGAEVLLARIGTAWGEFMSLVGRADGPAVLNVTRSQGAQEVQDTWRAIVGGRSRPDAGHVASL